MYVLILWKLFGMCMEYGFHNNFYTILKIVLKKCGFAPSPSDNCIFSVFF